jgi:hypothetical protein
MGRYRTLYNPIVVGQQVALVAFALSMKLDS